MLTQTKELVGGVGSIISTLIPIAFAAALLFFFWGVAKYILSAGTEKEEGKKIMVWGVVALFVISSIWGIVAWIRGELGGGVLNNTNIEVPTINSSGGGNTNTAFGNPGSTFVNPCTEGETEDC